MELGINLTNTLIKVLCDEMFSQIEGNERKFSPIELCISIISKFVSSVCRKIFEKFFFAPIDI